MIAPLLFADDVVMLALSSQDLSSFSQFLGESVCVLCFWTVCSRVCTGWDEKRHLHVRSHDSQQEKGVF